MRLQAEAQSIGGPSSLKGLFKRGPQDYCFVFTEGDLPPVPADSLLPPQITSDVPNTFARDSIFHRIPDDIIGRVLKENEAYLHQHPRSKELLLLLQQDMRAADTTAVRPLETFEGSLEAFSLVGAPEAPCLGGSPEGPPCGFCSECELRDIQMWNKVLLKEALDRNITLCKIPWILAEVYCYRRILHAFDFFRTLYDPFLYQKMAGLSAAAAKADVYGQQVAALLQQHPSGGDTKDRNTKPSPALYKHQIRSAVFASLEGNAGDLSLWPAKLCEEIGEPAQERGKPQSVGEQEGTFFGGPHSWLLADDFEAFFEDLCNRSKNCGCSSNSQCSRCSGVVHLWTDNAGGELLSDLLLCSCLLLTGAARSIRLCVKQQPTYVSDVTKPDLEMTIRWMQSQGQVEWTATPPKSGSLNILSPSKALSEFLTRQLSFCAVSNVKNWCLKSLLFVLQDVNLSRWGALLREWLVAGVLIVSASFFCCSPLELRRAPKPIVSLWEKEAALIILKGDMNYRRLIGQAASPKCTSPRPYLCTQEQRAPLGTMHQGILAREPANGGGGRHSWGEGRKGRGERPQILCYADGGSRAPGEAWRPIGKAGYGQRKVGVGVCVSLWVVTNNMCPEAAT
ncbi:uncharacterized protein LOC34619071 [Cyclospora cayetanensis]|uniref:Uncharacterized protein LOC34619071 n=1 Tax=Cyclospora cayetanensis TaxID=88456 RepID=A0A6P6S079_9EIME|nr:uncharacterized protein LOC34619071 [Cyclospora cayetanensis]